jgi:endonuclease YncB( thermonuclease family)
MAHTERCERIVDGDTLFVLCDLGLNQYSYQSLRLEDVFAPELFSGTSRESGAQARDYLTSICPPGTTLQMYTQKDASTFGRYVATIKMADGTIVNEAMRAWLEEKGYTGGTGA